MRIISLFILGLVISPSGQAPGMPMVKIHPAPRSSAVEAGTREQAMKDSLRPRLSSRMFDVAEQGRPPRTTPDAKGKNDITSLWERSRHFGDRPEIGFSTSMTISAIEGKPSTISNAEVTDQGDSLVQSWAAHYASGLIPSVDVPSAITVDAQGNVYITGQGDSTFTSDDIVTNKYNSVGSLIWSRRYNGPINMADIPYAIAVDASGNVYIVGTSWGLGTWYDYVTIKYNSLGVEQWVARYDGPDHDWDIATSIAVDGGGNVYVGGGSYSLSTTYDFAVVKYNSFGAQQWVARYNGSLDFDDGINALRLDASENIVVTGLSNSFEGGADFVTIKYSPEGGQLWLARYAWPYLDEAYAMTFDESENIYVTGYSFVPNSNDQLYADYLTIKYASDGTERWAVRYNGPGDRHDVATAIGVDDFGNVTVAGRSYNASIDFDYFTIQYDSNGVQRWSDRYDGGFLDDGINALAVDEMGNVIVTGNSALTNQDFNFVSIKYASSGARQWTVVYDGPAHDEDWPNGVCVDPSGNVLVTGLSRGTNTGLDYATIKYNTTGSQVWLRRYNGAGGSVERLAATAVDPYGNVHEAITSSGDGISQATFIDMVTLKYSADGVQEWLQRYDSVEARAVAIDRAGNVYASGEDLSSLPTGYLTIKYDRNGNELWVAKAALGRPNAIAVDQWENVYVTGPGGTIKYSITGVQQLFISDSGGSLKIDDLGNVYIRGRNVSKYNPAGQRKWSGVFSGWPSASTIDGDGNVYVTGFNGSAWVANKYNTNGVLQWITPYPGTSTTSIHVDTYTNVFVQGDGGTVKYFPNGNQQWVIPDRWESPELGTLATDGCGNSYLSGITYDTIPPGWLYGRIETSKFSPDGSLRWRQTFDPFVASFERSSKIALDGAGNVYIAGDSWIGSGFPYYFTNTVKYSPVPMLHPGQDSLLFGETTVGCVQADTLILEMGSCLTPGSVSVTMDDSSFIVIPLSPVNQLSSPIEYLVTFAPTTPGNKSALLTFDYPPNGSSATIPVSGTGIIVPPEYSATELAFDDVSVGCSESGVVQVVNNHCTPLAIRGGSSEPNFTVSIPSAMIPPFDSSLLVITFAPLGVGPHSGEILLAYPQDSLVDTIRVAGIGIGSGTEVGIVDSFGLGWQLISVPVTPECPTIYPSSYRYFNGYLRQDTLTIGAGYWNKLSHPQIAFAGEPVSEWTQPVLAKWNIIGSISAVIPTATISTTPPGIIQSPFYTYTSTGYSEADTIKPGHGYWVRVSQSGVLNIQAGSAAIPLTSATDRPELSSITLIDANGNQRKLFLTEHLDNHPSSWYELPPQPPEGAFDIRFSSGRNLEILSPNSPTEYPIHITGATYPIAIHWDMHSSPTPVLALGSEEIPMAGTGDAEIRTEGVSAKIKTSGREEVPTEYLLGQNYPNPFNPSTTVTFGLPERGRARLQVFDVLGRAVETIVDQEMEAGIYHRDWNAAGRPSGVYHILLSVTESGTGSRTFSSSIRALLLK